MGVGRVRLDTARFMDAAQGLYRSAGFREAAGGEESEIPAAFRAYWVGMAVGL
jgi:ribosomal protein S18 acetylase RimI-like enzyme